MVLVSLNSWHVFFVFREEELSHNVELTADLINPEVDLKFFPAAPVDKDVTNRVSTLSYIQPQRCTIKASF